MSAFDALLHLVTLFIPAAGLAALSALLTKLLWRRELKSVSWHRLAWPTALVCALVTIGGLVIFGQDGRMATYGAMVVLSALTLWWRGFGPGRR